MAFPQDKVRLTTAQAVVKYLSVQYSERDGVERRFIPRFSVFSAMGTWRGWARRSSSTGRT